MVNRALEQLRRLGARDALRAIARGLPSAGPRLEAAAMEVVARKIPRLVIWGGQDRINPVVETKLSAFAGETLLVPDTGHLPHIEAPQAVNPKLLSFLASVDDRAASQPATSAW
jgi:pyruvate dehydrogenase E2 component (dihydrolipoamide acetyltransferase)